jgi:hypothetical protein
MLKFGAEYFLIPYWTLDITSGFSNYFPKLCVHASNAHFP